MAYLDLILKFFLFLQNGYFIVPFMLWGFFHYNRKAFSIAAMLCLSATTVNFYLKTYFQVPLNEAVLGHQGWAYPSGHTVLNSVLWFSLMILIWKRWVAYSAAFVLPLGFVGMIYFKYHTIDDILAGLLVSAVFVAPLLIWRKWNYEKRHYLGMILLIITAFVLTSVPKVDLHGKLFANLGVLLGIIFFEYLVSNQLKDKLVYYKKRSMYYIISAISISYISILLLDRVKFDGMSDNFIIMFVSTFLTVVLVPSLINRLLRERIKQER